MDSLKKHRIVLSSFFFTSGFCFASYASRIPTLKTTFNLNEAELGTILLCMPFSSLSGLLFSGWLVAKFESRIPITVAFSIHALSLTLIGLSNSILVLIPVLCLFALSMRVASIAINTQALTLQKMFNKNIAGSFHGLWSTGGIAGIGFSTLMVAMKISILPHLITVTVITLAITIICSPKLLRNDRSTSGNKIIMGKPDPYIFYLGLLVFCASICEGGMFDWSGIYFQEVIGSEVFTFGYLIFMVFMSLSRFASDPLITKIGMAKTYILSAILIFSGILIAILFPSFWPAMFGFSLVGFGSAFVIPMTFTLAGNSKKYSPGMAISIISSFSIVGMLIGPPLIGYLAYAFNLRVSFILFAFVGMLLIPISQLFFAHRKALQKME